MFKTCVSALFTALPTSSSYHLFLTNNDDISVMLCLSYSASDGIFFFFLEILLLNALSWSQMELSIKKAIRRLSICKFSYKRAFQNSTVYTITHSQSYLPYMLMWLRDNNVIHISQHLPLLPGLGCRREMASLCFESDFAISTAISFGMAIRIILALGASDW